MMPMMTLAQNPIISGQFSADPTARVFNDRMYVYPSHDIDAPADQRQDWFCMEDYHVFSSENLTEWTDHGMILSQTTVPWGNPRGYSMWAPDCVCKDGKYYFYFPNAPKGGRGFAVGVAIADAPEGPFRCEPTPIRGVSGIDPCVLMDDDGSAYLYWSGMGIRGAKLKADMTELDGELTVMQMPRRPQADSTAAALPPMPPMVIGGQAMEGLPEGFKEGPFAFKQGGHYYLTFPWVRTDGGTETLAYAMSDNPLGPWTFKGIIMAEHANGCWTNHHSIVQYHGQWYLFYHHNDYSTFDKRRSVCADSLFFNPDGTIQEVKPTLRGIGVARATARLQVDRYSAIHPQASIAYLDTLDKFQGWYTTFSAPQSWVQFNNVDFTPVASARLHLRVLAPKGGKFLIRQDSSTGPVVAVVKARKSPGWQELTVRTKKLQAGIHHLVVEGLTSGTSVDWLQFE